ncbi:flavodoxin family protein [Sediminibacillus albus]|uniref:flavodoxin family protein n=1 Tax=Sediminibacillus albus TaxID=407036 RepID=UPI0015881175|nr:flavodoxin family protein [Sediminibacillus albus]
MLALLGSSRKEGNSEHLAKKALADIDYTSIYLRDYQINPILDKRHDAEGFTSVNDDYERLLEAFLAHDIIVFATPLYWFGMSGQMKNFFDRWSQYMRDSRYNFKGEIPKKSAYTIVTGNSPDPKISALPLIQQFHYIFDYIGMEFADYIIGQANQPGDIANDSFAIQKAELWNQKFKKNLNSTR